MEQKFIDLYDTFTHTGMSRREYIERMTKLAGGAAIAASIVDRLDLKYANAATIEPTDTRIKTESISFSYGKDQTAKGYLARPADPPKGNAAKAPSVVVIHENRGLNAYIEDVARRLAVAGFVALAPDGLSPLGGTPPDMEKAKTLVGTLDLQVALSLFVGATTFLRTSPLTTGKVGAVGFCWGGAMSNNLAVNVADLDAAVPYYGRQPASDDVKKIKAPIQLHYAEKDDRVNAGIAEYEKALKAAGVVYESHMYKGAQHAFHNDASPDRYDQKSAELAWQRTLEFLNKHLGKTAT